MTTNTCRDANHSNRETRLLVNVTWAKVERPSVWGWGACEGRGALKCRLLRLGQPCLGDLWQNLPAPGMWRGLWTGAFISKGLSYTNPCSWKQTSLVEDGSFTVCKGNALSLDVDAVVKRSIVWWWGLCYMKKTQDIQNLYQHFHSRKNTCAPVCAQAMYH